MPETNKFDFNKLKTEIANTKKENAEREIAMGRVPAGAIMKGNKRSFLNELVSSMNTGMKTNASETIRAVNETVEYKKGAPNAVRQPINRQPYQHQQVNQVQQHPNNAANEWAVPGVTSPHGGNYGGERESLFEQNMMNANARFDQMRMGGGHPQTVQHPYGGQPQYITESAAPIVEHDDFARNIGKIVESEYKNLVTEIYTKQKINEALSDFLKSEDFIKIVGNAINEIAKRKKPK